MFILYLMIILYLMFILYPIFLLILKIGDKILYFDINIFKNYKKKFLLNFFLLYSHFMGNLIR